MCATCVAQGIGYVGSALVGLQVMGARAKAKRRSSGDASVLSDAAPFGSPSAGSASSDGSAAPVDSVGSVGSVGSTDESEAVTSL
jgi:hypothetical protein